MEQKVEPYRDPREVEQGKLREITCPAADALFQQLETGLRRLASFENLQTRVGQVQQAAQLIRNLSYDDYRQLVGAINKLRDEEQVGKVRSGLASMQVELRHSDSLGRFSEHISEMFQSQFECLDGVKMPSARPIDAAENGEGRSMLPAVSQIENITPKQFVMDTLLLARMVYPLGVNVANASWNPQLGPTSLSARDVNMVQLGEGVGGSSFETRPKVDGIEIRYVATGCSWAESAGGIHVQPGKAVIVGRPGPEMSSVYGLHTTLFGRADLATHESAWSRGAVLMVLDQSDRLFILDRGSRNNLVVSIDGRKTVRYEPKVIAPEDGSRGASSFGHSEFFPPGPEKGTGD